MAAVESGVHARAVRKAVELAGGQDRLAERLALPSVEVGRWLSGQSQPPHEAFLRVVDFLLEEGA